jgi:hypothetical protein
MRVPPEGEAVQLADFKGKWVDHVAAHEAGVRAAGVGKALHVFDAAGAALKTLLHPSSVGGITFDAKGKRVAASHYNGASLWFVGAKEDKPACWSGRAATTPSPSPRTARMWSPRCRSPRCMAGG